MAFTHFRPRRPPRSPLSWHHQTYHDYVRCTTPGDGHSFGCLSLRHSPTVLGGTVRIPLSSPKVIGIANSRGERA